MILSNFFWAVHFGLLKRALKMKSVIFFPLPHKCPLVLSLFQLGGLWLFQTLSLQTETKFATPHFEPFVSHPLFNRFPCSSLAGARIGRRRQGEHSRDSWERPRGTRAWKKKRTFKKGGLFKSPSFANCPFFERSTLGVWNGYKNWKLSLSSTSHIKWHWVRAQINWEAFNGLKPWGAGVLQKTTLSILPFYRISVERCTLGSFKGAKTWKLLFPFTSHINAHWF